MSNLQLCEGVEWGDVTNMEEAEKKKSNYKM